MTLPPSTILLANPSGRSRQRHYPGERGRACPLRRPFHQPGPDPRQVDRGRRATCCRRAFASPIYRQLRSRKARTPCEIVPSIPGRREYSVRYTPVDSRACAARNASNPSRHRTVHDRRYERVNLAFAGHARQSVVEDLMHMISVPPGSTAGVQLTLGRPFARRSSGADRNLPGSYA